MLNAAKDEELRHFDVFGQDLDCRVSSSASQAVSSSHVWSDLSPSLSFLMASKAFGFESHSCLLRAFMTRPNINTKASSESTRLSCIWVVLTDIAGTRCV